MNLDIDIGNTRLKWRLSAPDATVLGQGFVNTQGLDAGVLGDAWRALPTPGRVRFVSVAGDGAERVLIDFCRQRGG